MAGGYGGGALSVDLPLWGFLGRGIVFVIGFLLVIPAPWVASGSIEWMLPRVQVPGRPNLAFTGQVGDIWWVFIAIGADDLCRRQRHSLSSAHLRFRSRLPVLDDGAVDRRPTSRRTASRCRSASTAARSAYIGWDVLLNISFITIIGWAWVIAAWMRWNCRNIDGTRREVIFNGTGLEVLWRTIVFVIGCVFIIPIPWVMRWYAAGTSSQIALADSDGVSASA